MGIRNHGSHPLETVSKVLPSQYRKELHLYVFVEERKCSRVEEGEEGEREGEEKRGWELKSNSLCV